MQTQLNFAELNEFELVLNPCIKIKTAVPKYDALLSIYSTFVCFCYRVA